MSRLRGLLPLFLCAAVLAAGAALPQLLLRHTPDYKNTPETIAIAGTGNPMYVAPDADLVFAPWDQLDRGSPFPATDYLYEENIEKFAERIEQTLALLPPDYACTPDGTDIFKHMVTIDGTIFFLEDYALESKGAPIRIKMALSLDNIPLYLSFTAEGNQPEAHRYPSALETNFGIAAELWTASYPRADIAALAEANYGQSTVITFIRFFCALDALPAFETVTCASPWLAVLEDRKTIRAFTYREQTCVTAADSQNRVAALFFDQKSRCITGFSVDPLLADEVYTQYWESIGVSG